MIRYGAFDKIEFRFSSDLLYNTSENEFSINPVQLGTKIQIVRKESFQLSLISMTTLDNEEQNTNIKIVGNNKFLTNLVLDILLDNNFSANVNSFKLLHFS